MPGSTGVATIFSCGLFVLAPPTLVIILLNGSPDAHRDVHASQRSWSTPLPFPLLSMFAFLRHALPPERWIGRGGRDMALLRSQSRPLALPRTATLPFNGTVSQPFRPPTETRGKDSESWFPAPQSPKLPFAAVWAPSFSFGAPSQPPNFSEPSG